MTESAKFLVRALLCSARRAATRRGHVRPSANRWRTAQRIAAHILVLGARARWGLPRKRWSPFWGHVLVSKITKCCCDGECQVVGARAALFDSSRRDASPPCAAEYASLAQAHTNCRADFGRRRTLTLGSAARTIAIVLGTCSVTKIMRCLCDGEWNVSGSRAALFDSSRRDAPRRCAAECEPLAHALPELSRRF